MCLFLAMNKTIIGHMKVKCQKLLKKTIFHMEIKIPNCEEKL